MKTFLNTIYGKAIAVLTIFALTLGIIAEGVNIYKSSNEAKIAKQKAAIELQTARNAELLKKAEAVKLEAEAGAAEEIARNAERLRVAEAEERAQLAKKAAAEAETAREAANNAAKLKLAEADERSWLAKKAAADAETARAAADNAGKLKLAEAQKAAADAEAAREAANNAAKLRFAEAEERLQKSRTAKAEADVSPEMQAATLAKTRAEAEKLDGEAVKAQMIACAFDPSRCSPEQRRIIAGDQGVGSRIFDLSTAAQQRLAGTNLSTGTSPQTSADVGKNLSNLNLSVTDRLSGGTGDPLRNGILARPEPQNEAPARLATLRVKSDESDGKLNLRNGPGLRHNVIAELPAGTLLHQVGACIPSDDGVTHDPWCKVDWNGTTGWASSSGLERYARP